MRSGSLPNSQGRESTSTRSRINSSGRALTPSSNPGMTSWVKSPQRARCSGRRVEYLNRRRSMTAKTAPPLTARPAWKALQDHYQEIRNVHLRTLFSQDPRRGERFAVDAAGLYLDYSKHRITDETMRLLLRLAEEAGLRARIDAMFAGEKINVTEQRAVLHVALRAPRGESIVVDGKNVVPGVHEVLDQMADFSNRIRSGEWKGHTGKRIRNIINIGIGGSDLGPVMAYEAL